MKPAYLVLVVIDFSELVDECGTRGRLGALLHRSQRNLQVHLKLLTNQCPTVAKIGNRLTLNQNFHCNNSLRKGVKNFLIHYYNLST